MISIILTSLINRLSIFIIIAYILSKTHAFQRLILKHKVSFKDKLLLSLIFGAFGILGTYSGIPIYGAIANSRTVGVIIGGLLGGPFVGILSGFIASFHRWIIDIGGFTSVACSVATFCEATIAGLLHKKLNKPCISWKEAFLTGIILEFLQMGIILLIARPYLKALELVKIIWFPMTFVNAAGIAIFISIVEAIFKEQERAGAYQAKLALNIASQTLPYLRKGLNEISAYKTVEIIYKNTDYDAVAITDRQQILSHIGAEEDHHKTGVPVMTHLTQRALKSRTCEVAMSKNDIECSNKNCSLSSAVIAPLIEKNHVIGCLKLYKTRKNSMTDIDIKLAEGLALLFSTQLELAKAEYQAHLLAKAQRKALQAQINPHFLFNALNTIIAVLRDDSGKARELLIHLSSFFRKNLSNNKELVPLEQEIEHVNAYLAIEQARFGDRLKVKYEIDPDIKIQLPPLILQPLVENSVKHGLLPKEEGGTVLIRINKSGAYAKISVIDNGIGIKPDVINSIFSKSNKNNDKIGVKNVSKRLQSFYGNMGQLEISSTPGLGTKVCFYIPLLKFDRSEASGA